MRAPQLADIEAKLRYATEQLEQFRTAGSTWHASNPVKVTSRIDLAAGQVIFTLVQALPLTRLSIMAGLIINNLRSVLDHLVCLLVEKNGGAPDKSTAFPFYQDAAKFDKECQRKELRGASGAVVASIRELQPFNHTAGQSGLDLLRLLDNEYKHHLVRLIGLTPKLGTESAIEIAEKDCVIGIPKLTTRTLTQAGEVARADVRVTGPHPSLECHFRFPETYFAFENRESVEMTILRSAWGIEQVCLAFDAYLLDGSPPTGFTIGQVSLVPGVEFDSQGVPFVPSPLRIDAPLRDTTDPEATSY